MLGLPYLRRVGPLGEPMFVHATQAPRANAARPSIERHPAAPSSRTLAATRDRESWETSAPAPFVVIRVGGPLQGVLTLSAVADGRTLVIASWFQDAHTHWGRAEVESFGHARVLARTIIDQLAAGTPPDLRRD